MMRSLFSGVAGLKTHQTRMDVIGNNIANVNTTAYKSQSMTFSDIMYQTTQNASGASEKRGGVNARQIGLGVQTSAISTAIEQQGASQTTNNPFDIMISGDAFFVVNNGQQNLYTRDGTFYVDGVGNLAMQATGYLVQGWSSKDGQTVDINGGIGKLQIMSAENLTYPPAATTASVMTGNVDALDINVNSSAGRITTLEFYDDRGYLYTAKFSLKRMRNADDTPMTSSNRADSPDEKNQPMYSITLMDVLDSQNVSIGADAMENVTFGNDASWTAGKLTDEKETSLKTKLADAATKLTAIGTPDATNLASMATSASSDLASFKGSLQDLKSNATLENDSGVTVSSPLAGIAGEFFELSDATIDSFGKNAQFEYDATAKTLKISSKGKTNVFQFDPDTGALVEGGNLTLGFDNNPPKGLESFKNVKVDATTLTNVNTNKSSTFKMTKGDIEGQNTGRMVGNLNGISVETDGKIWASYSNGQTKLLGQIASAEFANASGLEKGGDNLYRATNNSGDPVIQSIDADGGRMNTGVLEMSNVDLSSEFTTMITTQRGFQANSRIITVSDSLLEELTNLKR